MKRFEDFEVGQTYPTQDRTIAEADIVRFVEMCGLYEPLFVNLERVKEDSLYDRRFAPGALTMSCALGNCVRTGILDEALAMVAFDATFEGPVFADDTISGDIEIVEKRETSRDDRGLIVYESQVTNQRDEHIMDICESTLVKTEKYD